MADKWESEKELGKAVVDYYREQGWTVYPEICDIDIVAKKDDKIIGIECKKHFNLTVLAQAQAKKRYVDEMFVAVSRGWKNNEEFGCQIAIKFGFGVIYVDKSVKYGFAEEWKPGLKMVPIDKKYSVTERVAAVLNPRKSDDVDKLLSPQAETFAEAGQVGAKHWTMFKKTGAALVEYVQANPGTSMKEAVKNIEHHYSSESSAKGCLARGIREGLIQGIKYEGKVLVPTSFSF